MAVKLDPDLIHPDSQPYIQTNAIPLHSDQEAQMLTPSDRKSIPTLTSTPPSNINTLFLIRNVYAVRLRSVSLVFLKYTHR